MLQIIHNKRKPKLRMIIEAIKGATIPLLCQKKFAKPLTLPAFLPPIRDTAEEFAGVIINLTKPINTDTMRITLPMDNKAVKTP